MRVLAIRDDLLQVRDFLVNFYVLADEDGLHLIDSGFIFGIRGIEKALGLLGREWKDIRSVFLTHGHIDHVKNSAEIKYRSGALIYGNAQDQLHFNACFPYRGVSRVCGALEFVGRLLSGYNHFELDVAVDDGVVYDAWGGLRCIFLPGHTVGHCGYYSPKLNLLFSGDLFSNWTERSMLPPAFLNTCPSHFSTSIERVLKLNPDGILPGHCDSASPEIQRERFFRSFSS